jgi:hypothetical protein
LSGAIYMFLYHPIRLIESQILFTYQQSSVDLLWVNVKTFIAFFYIRIVDDVIIDFLRCCSWKYAVKHFYITDDEFMWGYVFIDKNVYRQNKKLIDEFIVIVIKILTWLDMSEFVVMVLKN